MTQQLATLINAGLPLLQACRTLAHNTQNIEQRSILLGISHRVAKGDSLAQALECYPNHFPPLYRSMVRSAWQGGELGQQLDRLANHLAERRDFQQQLTSALYYPAAVLILSLSLIAFLMLTVLPQLLAVFQHSQQPLPKLTRLFLALSQWLQHYGSFAALLLLLLAALIYWLLQKPALAAYYHGGLLKIPIVGQFISTLHTTRCLQIFSMLLRSGQPIVPALTQATAVISLHPIRQSLQRSCQQLQNGYSLAGSLSRQYFSATVLECIAVGEKSGRLSELLDQVCSQQRQALLRSQNQLLKMIEPLLIVMMGLVVLLIVLAVMQPMIALDVVSLT